MCAKIRENITQERKGSTAMRANRAFPKYTVTPKAEAALLRGHPWVYGEEVVSAEGEAAKGGVVYVVSRMGRYLGTGFL